MNKKTRIALIAIIGIVILLIAFFPRIKRMWSADQDEPASGRAPQMSGRSALSVNATILEPQTLNDMFRMIGILLPDEEVDLTFETSGKITNIYFKEGTYVQKGALLAKVNDAPLQAELKKLQARLPLAESRVYRQQTLLEKDAVSQEAFQSVTTDLETLKADIDLVKSRIKQTELRAPFSGYIGLREVSEGAYASPSVKVATLTKLSPLKIEFSVSEGMSSSIQPGSVINFTVENSLDTYQAHVYALESKLDKNTLTMIARARYDNPGGKIKPGQSASVNFQLQTIENALVIPTLSTVKELGRDITYVYSNGKAKQVEIVTGLRTSSSVQVVSGLSVGDTVLTTGVMQLRDDMPVKLNDLVPNKSGQ